MTPEPPVRTHCVHTVDSVNTGELLPLPDYSVIFPPLGMHFFFFDCVVVLKCPGKTDPGRSIKTKRLTPLLEPTPKYETLHFWEHCR